MEERFPDKEEAGCSILPSPTWGYSIEAERLLCTQEAPVQIRLAPINLVLKSLKSPLIFRKQLIFHQYSIVLAILIFVNTYLYQ